MASTRASSLSLAACQRLVQPASWRKGFPSRAEATRRYGRATGFDLGAIDWYHVFGVFKIAVVLQQIYVRYLRGQTQDERFAVFGTRVAALFDKAATMTGG